VLGDWGEFTGAFNATEAARDVLAVATRLRRKNQEVLVWGASYGGYWAHRLLQVDRGQLFSAAVFDSAALPIGGHSTLHQTLEVHEAGDVLLAACRDDGECSAHLGPDPKTRALEILDHLCDRFSDPRRGGRVGVQGLISSALRRWRLLRLIPAILYRAERCSDADVRYLDAYAAQLTPDPPFGAVDVPQSLAILLHIMFTEMVTELSDPEDIYAASDAEVFSSVAGSVDMQAALAEWPHYALDEFVGNWAESDIPMLILHGGLDTQTRPSVCRARAPERCRSRRRPGTRPAPPRPHRADGQGTG
jgi:fermentation-respiration switch protein FrsA (DUF1100 family)